MGSPPSLCVTYLLLFAGGFCGLHHFYLGNSARAFLYCATFGGCFGLALLWDVLTLHDLVRILPRQNIYEGFANFNTWSFVTWLYARYFSYALTMFDTDRPGAEESAVAHVSFRLIPLTTGIGAAVGTWLATAAGLSDNQYQRWGFKQFLNLATVAVCVGYVLTLVQYLGLEGWTGDDVDSWRNFIVPIVVVFFARPPAHSVFDHGVKDADADDSDEASDDDVVDQFLDSENGDNNNNNNGQQQTANRSCCCRYLTVYFFAVPLFFACLFKTLSADLEVDTEAGVMKLDQVLVNLWYSEVMEDVWNELGSFASCLHKHGMAQTCFDDYLERLDLDGECEAYDAMELHWCDYGETYRPDAPASVLLKKIKSQYRKLALQYHPDKVKDGNVRMLEVSAAYELLKSIYQTRIEAEDSATREL